MTEAERAECLLLMLDTPGGLVDSTRDIVKKILGSRTCVIVYVAPSGARAASAGVFITLAAHVAAMAGYSVNLYDIKQEFVDRGIAGITANLDKGIEKGKVSDEQKQETLASLTGSTDLNKAVSGVGLVIEAIPENLELKTNLYRELDAICPAETTIESAGAPGSPSPPA